MKLVSQTLLLHLPMLEKRTPKTSFIDQFAKSLTRANSKKRKCQCKAEFLEWRKSTTGVNFTQKKSQLFLLSRCYLWLTKSIPSHFILVGLNIHISLTKNYFMLYQTTGVFEYIILSRYSAMVIHSAIRSEKSQTIPDLYGMHKRQIILRICYITFYIVHNILSHPQ